MQNLSPNIKRTVNMRKENEGGDGGGVGGGQASRMSGCDLEETEVNIR